MKKTLTKYTKKELQSIHGYSKRLNRMLKKDHARVLLDMMRAHTDEIKELYNKKDKHYLIETGDLIVLCLELMREAKQSPDAVLFKCYPRFHKKLLQLIKEQKDRSKRGL
ncbi:MAG: hypothetical protein HQL14_05785 [Candidatus Omnitrophica bacterium]|nr:hypothetical protein [Candidatus Omnitrophota bacterium]